MLIYGDKGDIIAANSSVCHRPPVVLTKALGIYKKVKVFETISPLNIDLCKLNLPSGNFSSKLVTDMMFVSTFVTAACA